MKRVIRLDGFDLIYKILVFKFLIFSCLKKWRKFLFKILNFIKKFYKLHNNIINRFCEKILNKIIYILKSKFTVFRNNIFVSKCY